MKIMKPGIELIDAPDYGAMLKKIERIGRICYPAFFEDLGDKHGDK